MRDIRGPYVLAEALTALVFSEVGQTISVAVTVGGICQSRVLPAFLERFPVSDYIVSVEFGCNSCPEHTRAPQNHVVHVTRKLSRHWTDDVSDD